MGSWKEKLGFGNWSKRPMNNIKDSNEYLNKLDFIREDFIHKYKSKIQSMKMLNLFGARKI